MFTLLVTSTATTTISVIPTDTPVTRWVVNACVVDASGDVYVSDNYSDVSYYSYGRLSPSTSPIFYEHGAYCVVLDGDLSISYDNIDGSYGRIQSPDTSYGDSACLVVPPGDVGG